MKLFLIIPVFNRKDTLINCLTLLRNQTFTDFTTIVVDDGSSDGTSRVLKSDFPEVKIVAGDGSWWWSKSINEGIKLANELGAEGIITMNDDTFFENDYLEHLVTAINQNPKAIIGTLLLTKDNNPKIFYSGIYKINWLISKSYKYYQIFEPFDPSMTGLHKSVLLTGTGMYVPMEVFNRIGYFDNINFPQNLGDFDFILRAGKAGFETLISWDARNYSIIDKTGAGASFVKQSFWKFLKAFFKPRSRTNLAISFKYYWRHCPKILLPISFSIDKVRVIWAYFRNQRHYKTNKV